MSEPSCESPAESRWRLLPLFAVLGLGFGLFACGISWGLPSARGWAGDEILPVAVAKGMAHAFSGRWHTKYPPFHYYVLALVRYPTTWIAGWTGTELNTALLYAGRWTSVLMSLGTLLFTYLTGREIYGWRGGVWASLVVALVAPLVYFAKTANVEAPFVFWVAASLFFFVRILRHHRLGDYMLFPALAALAVTTKDQAYGMYILSPLPILASLHRARADAASLAGWTKTLFDRRVWAAFAVFVVVFVLSANLLLNFSGYVAHWQTITGHQSEDAQAYPGTVAGQAENLWQNVRHLGFSHGLPLFILGALGALRALLRKDSPGAPELRALLVLGLSYYFFFLAVILFARDRFVLPLCLIVALCAGGLLADLVGRGRARLWRIAAVASVIAYSVVYAAGVDVAMAHDARYAVEKWVASEVRSDQSVLAIGRAKHLPTMQRLDWNQLRNKDWRALKLRRPDFLAVNPGDLRDDLEMDSYQRLRSGELGYTSLRDFTWDSPWILLDSRGYYTSLIFINPRIEIFQRVPVG